MIKIYKGIVWPQFPSQFFSRDDIPCVAKENDQDPKWLILELDFEPVFA